MPYAALHPGFHSLGNPSTEDLERLARDVAPAKLIILDYRLETFAPLAVLKGLENLRLQGGMKVRDLAPLAALSTLRELVLSIPTGSDGSGRVIDVASFAPLASLTALERLILLSVRPRDLDLSPIATMKHLKDLDIGGVREFTLEHYARLAAALPHTEGRCLQAYCVIPGVGFCRKCRAQQVLLNGTPPRARKWLCPTCQASLIAAHVERWETAKAKSAGEGARA
jgi:hypothetical protein